MQVVITLFAKYSNGPYFESNHCHKSYKKRKIYQCKKVVISCVRNIRLTIYIAQHIIGIMNQPLLCAFRELIKTFVCRK